MSDYSRQEALASVRKDVVAAAKKGQTPSAGPNAAHIEEAFDGHGGSEALARLEEEAREAQRQRAERNRLAAQKRRVEDRAKKIVAEWEEKARADRLEAARAEAKKQLGITA